MIGNIVGTVICYAFLATLSFYVIRTWKRWFRSDPKLVQPEWRSAITIFGFAASTASLVAIIGLAVHAFITGGLPYYHPVLMFAFRLGFLTALLGMVAALIGTGPLEVPTIVCSVLSLLIWIVEALAQ
jgi:hypothetical protein